MALTFGCSAHTFSGYAFSHGVVLLVVALPWGPHALDVHWGISHSIVSQDYSWHVCGAKMEGFALLLSPIPAPHYCLSTLFRFCSELRFFHFPLLFQSDF